jgi:hypothetical protein
MEGGSRRQRWFKARDRRGEKAVNPVGRVKTNG